MSSIHGYVKTVSALQLDRKDFQETLRRRYGTAIRTFHPFEKHWVVTWINPVDGAHNVLIARREGADIVQEGRDENGNPMRWIFSDIAETSARWRRESSVDKSVSWKLVSELFLTRTQE